MGKHTRIALPSSVSRRDFLRAGFGSVIGLSAASYLIGCGQASTPAPSQASTAPSSAPASAGAPAVTPTADAAKARAALIDAANKEGQLLWYSSAIAEWGTAIIKAFNSKYPNIKVEQYRANNEEIRERAITEFKSGKNEADVVEGGIQDNYYYVKEGLFRKHKWPDASSFPADFRDPDGYWLATRWVPQVIAYNTKILSAAEAPKTWEDLIDPKWKGKLGIEEDDSTWLACILKYMGQDKGMDYLQKLSDQKPRLGKGHSTLTNLLAAGEFPVLVVTYPNLVEGPKAKGAPVDWVRVNPTFSAGAFGVGIVTKAPHPNAAQLWAEWQTSDDGQKAQADIGNPPGKKDVPGVSAIIKEQNSLKVVSLSTDYGPHEEEMRTLYQKIFWPNKT